MKSKRPVKTLRIDVRGLAHLERKEGAVVAMARGGTYRVEKIEAGRAVLKRIDEEPNDALSR